MMLLFKRSLWWGGLLLLVTGSHWAIGAKALLPEGYDQGHHDSSVLPVPTTMDRMYFSSRQATSSSSSAGHSQLQSQVTLSAQELASNQILLQVRGTASTRQIFVNGQPSNLSADSASEVLLHPYLRPGINTIQLSGSGSAQLEILLLQMPKGSLPQISGDILVHQSLSRSGAGSWQAVIVIRVV